MALASTVAVGLLAIDFHGIFLGVAGWALLIAAVCVAFWQGTLFPRHCVVSGGEIVVYPDRVLVPRAFSGAPEEIAFSELELEVSLDQRGQRVVPTRVTIGRRERPRVLHPSVFSDPAQVLRLADDIRRLRAGLPVTDEYDALLDEEPRALETPDKRDQK